MWAAPALPPARTCTSNTSSAACIVDPQKAHPPRRSRDRPCRRRSVTASRCRPPPLLAKLDASAQRAVAASRRRALAAARGRTLMPIYAGLISGTSMDGVEAVALQIDAARHAGSAAPLHVDYPAGAVAPTACGRGESGRLQPRHTGHAGCRSRRGVRRCGAAAAGNRRACQPARCAPSAATDRRCCTGPARAALHAADRGCEPHCRTHRHRRDRRLSPSRHGRRRRGRAAGAGLSRGGLWRARRSARGGEHRRHRQCDAAACRRQRQRLRHRAGQLPDGPVGAGTPGRAL